MRTYLENFYSEFDYPDGARAALDEAYDKIYANERAAEIFDTILSEYKATHAINMADMKEDLNLAAKLSGAHEYTVKLLIHICLSKELRAQYAKRGLDDALWVGAMSDLKWKLIECHLIRGVWGTFVADIGWFSRWYNLTRFAFYRLQFELTTFKNEYEKNGVKLTKDSKAINIHIPRTGTPLDHGEVEKAYAMAKEFYKDEFGDEPMVFVCSSWLLFPENDIILHERSNIRKFMADFDIFSSGYYDEIRDSVFWRIFDCSEDTPMEKVPQDSFVKRAYKVHIEKGGKLGYGTGVFLA